MNVPYYRDLVNHGDLSEATAVSDLQRIPVLTKSIIRREATRLASNQPCGKTRWNTSGGSTGEPVRLLQDRNMAYYGRATELLFMRWARHKMGEPHVLIWGVPQATFKERVSIHEKFFRLVHNETYLNCYKITDNVLHSWVECINTKRPTLIEAYADAVYELSRLIVEEEISVERPRAIIASAGVLTQRMRETIIRAFGCPVLNRYGSREVGNVACSCMSNSELHINEYTCYVEIVDDNGNPCGDGVEGDILVTLLTNYAMPLIRYKIQDRGAWASGPCPCGRTTRRLANIVGRQSDYLLALDGSKINGTALTTLLYPVFGIKHYQYRQMRRDRVVLAVVPKDGASTDLMKKEIQSPLEKLKGMLNGVSVELAILDEIAPSKSGKYRYVQNEFARDDHLTETAT
jgi:phenylacetate-CoA ligase